MTDAAAADNHDDPHDATPVLTAALAYAAIGWAVFPVPQGTKKSHKAAKYSDGSKWGMSRDPGEIQRNWARWPNANIGVPTGAENGFFVTEADTLEGHGVDGISSLRQLEATHSPLPLTRTAISPSGSLHYYFKHPGIGIKVWNSTSRVGEGIDVRGDGGMVVAPPSVKPGVGVYRWMNEGPIAEAPEWLLALVTTDHEPDARRVVVDISGEPLPSWLIEKMAADAGKGLSSDPADLTKPPTVARAKAALAVIDPDIENGSWFEIGCGLFNTFGPELGLTLWDVWSSLGAKYKAGKMPSEWQRIVDNNGYNHTFGTVAHYAELADKDWWRRIVDDEPAQEQVEQSKSAAPDPKATGEQPGSTAGDKRQGVITSLADWLVRELPTPDFICGKWLTTTSRVLVDAETGIGKSMFGIALALAIAAGRPFLHWQGGRPVRVLYIDGEMARRVTRKRFADEVARLGEAPSGLHILSHEDLAIFLPLNTPQGQAVIEQHIKLIGGVDLIIFDNIMCLISGDQKDEEGWRQVMPWVRSLTRRCMGQVWLHHTGHDTTRSYGTKTREWQMDTHLHFDKVDPPQGDVNFRLTFRKAREREPATRMDFDDVEIKLVNNQWAWLRSSSGGLGRVSPMGRKFFEALCSVTDDHQMFGCPAAPIVDWRTACLQRGLIDEGNARAAHSARTLFSKHKGELVAADWISCNETMAWTLAPNPNAVF